MGYSVVNGVEMLINKRKLDAILNTKKMSYTELYNRAKVKFKLGLKKTSFMNLLENRVAWKLTYAWAVADVLGVDNIKDLFEPVEINVEKKVKEREIWKERYGKK